MQRTRKLVYHVAATLDGFIAGADDSFDFFPQQGDHIPDYLQTLQTAYDTAIMGRRTYEVGLKYGVADPYPFLETYVLSSSLGESPSPRVKVSALAPAELLRSLRTQPGRDIYLCGGGELARVCFAEQLIDELWVKLNPLLLGHGIPLVAPLAVPLPLRLLATKSYESGVVLLRYEVARSAA